MNLRTSKRAGNDLFPPFLLALDLSFFGFWALKRERLHKLEVVAYLGGPKGRG